MDPYLSHSVQELDAPDLVRQVPIPYLPQALTTVDWVLITHEHMDHCDPHTLPALAQASPQARFIGPLPVRKQLEQWGISAERIMQAPSDAFDLGAELSVQAIPAAHPRIRFDQGGQPQAVGYLFKHHGRSLYLAGDTSVCDELLEVLKDVGPIDTALLPVNEDNFFRRRRGIVGNMTIREAFGMAAELGIQSVVPVHWDMLAVNGASLYEIEAVYRSSPWPFRLIDASFAVL
ncbi:MBL fold metallo-hydrolase [Synechococcus sp. A10-1-5-1]|uniref:MBL fold metallo-hydrolase n=1 Tax=Synechococcus sp. A10-1-5-1 TaxID=2936507 RepID=UPI0020019085|nr:MBL fold metallo-hydrolase [Synechococcus sp. A10-1-5-1]